MLARNRAIGRTIIAVIVILIILVAGLGVYSLSMSRQTTSSISSSSSQSSTSTSSQLSQLTQQSSSSIASPTTSSQQSTSSSSSITTTSSSYSQSTNTSGAIPSSLTYETVSTIQYIDPSIAYFNLDDMILQNVYEPLLWFNGSSATDVIPWLAQNYTVYPNNTEISFTLRSGIYFQDGEPLNSTAVYFTFNRMLMTDASTPSSHGTQSGWLLQQFLNTNLSSTLTGPQNYSATYTSDVLNENFVTVTGPLTFSLNLMHPAASEQLEYLLASFEAYIIAPMYTMQHDLQLWKQPSMDYTLPYPNLSGNETNMINQYFYDQVATCNEGATPAGCGTTYLDGSYQGSMAGTGPYTIQSDNPETHNIVLQANPNYWGGPYQFSGGSKITPKIQTIYLNYVPSISTRELDLRNAAASGKLFGIDVFASNLFDVADRNSWLQNGTLVSTIPGVSVYGPFANQYTTLFIQFGMNVTNLDTGNFYAFQPFADLRFRLAFADAVNMSQMNEIANNNLGTVAQNLIPPGLPPQGVYNSSITPRYSYNLTAVQDLLLDAMLHPLTHFTFYNGTVAPQGTFNNTFGCSSLNSNGVCSNPVQQTIMLDYATGDTVDQTILSQIASVVNNVSDTYNMGLSVSIVPIPTGQLLTEEYSSYLYMYAGLGWGDDYPWVTDFLLPMLTPGGSYSGPSHFNYTVLSDLYNQASLATQSGNITGLVTVSNEMNTFANQAVLYLWTFNPLVFVVVTSNLHGFYWNQNFLTPESALGSPQYFAAYS